MQKEQLKEDGNYELIKFIDSKAKTFYRVQENKYGEEWDWSDYTDPDEASKEFDDIVAFIKASEEEEKQQKEALKEEHGEEAESHREFLDKVSG